MLYSSNCARAVGNVEEPLRYIHVGDKMSFYRKISQTKAI